MTYPMVLNDIKHHLSKMEKIGFVLPDGTEVPPFFHVTEVGKVTKSFIDCGGKLRNEEVVNFQLWSSNDYDHRLHPDKLLNIIKLAQDKLDIGNLKIEVEYQGDTIGKYTLDFDGSNFLLISTNTACLANEACGIPTQVETEELSVSNACTPGGGCC